MSQSTSHCSCGPLGSTHLCIVVTANLQSTPCWRQPSWILPVRAFFFTMAMAIAAARRARMGIAFSPRPGARKATAETRAKTAPIRIMNGAPASTIGVSASRYSIASRRPEQQRLGAGVDLFIRKHGVADLLGVKHRPDKAPPLAALFVCCAMRNPGIILLEHWLPAKLCTN